MTTETLYEDIFQTELQLVHTMWISTRIEYGVFSEEIWKKAREREKKLRQLYYSLKEEASWCREIHCVYPLETAFCIEHSLPSKRHFLAECITCAYAYALLKIEKEDIETFLATEIEE